MLLGGALAGTIIPCIVGIHAIGNVAETQFRAQRFHRREEFVLAVKAAVGVVALVLGPVQFFGLHYMQRHAQRARKGAGLIQIAAGQAGRVGQHCEHPVAQHTMRRGRQKCRVHAAGVSHHQAAEFPQPRLQNFQFCLHRRATGRGARLGFGQGKIRVCCCRHGADYTLLRLQRRYPEQCPMASIGDFGSQNLLPVNQGNRIRILSRTTRSNR